MIAHRESYAFEDDCKFCAQDTPLVSEVNTKVCPDCYSWITESVGLETLGIRKTD